MASSIASTAPAASAPGTARPFAELPSVPLPKSVQTARFVFRPLPFLEHWRARLGETFHASLLGPGEVVFLSDPESLKRLFTADRVNTIAPGRNIVLEPLLGPPLAAPTGGRRAPAPAQADAAAVSRRAHARLRAGDRARSTERAVAPGRSGAEFALHPSMQAITLEVILRAVFGVSDDARRERLRDDLVGILGATRLAGRVRVRDPDLRRLPPFGDRDPARPHRRVALRRDRRAAAPTRTSPSATTSSRCSSRRGSRTARRWPTRELRDQLMTLLLAGHETTATGLAWAFDLLLHHPAALERLRAELAAGEHDYLDAVVDETPAGAPGGPVHRPPAAPRLPTLGGFELARRHRDPRGHLPRPHPPRLYPRPASLPPRAIPRRRAPETYSWIPFGGGTRRCIGAAFAELEMRVAIETILGSVSLRAATRGARAPGAPQRHPLARRRDAGDRRPRAER